jgi:hypothetical protein
LMSEDSHPMWLALPARLDLVMFCHGWPVFEMVCQGM